MNSRQWIIPKYKKYCLKEIIPLCGINIEGNILTGFKNNRLRFPNKCRRKQINIIDLLKDKSINNILEIGFNTGFSCILFKLLFPQSKFLAIDINHHKYVVPCYNKIKTDFKNINIILETSLEALPKLNEKYDLIHIDGCHNYNVAKQDILNSLKLSKPGTIIIFDDTDQKELCNEFILSKNWSEIFTKIKYKQCHRFFKVI